VSNYNVETRYWNFEIMRLMVTPVLHIPYCRGNTDMVNKISLNGCYENTAHTTVVCIDIAIYFVI
jgi:hypothetical protein